MPTSQKEKLYIGLFVNEEEANYLENYFEVGPFCIKKKTCCCTVAACNRLNDVSLLNSSLLSTFFPLCLSPSEPDKVMDILLDFFSLLFT